MIGYKLTRGDCGKTWMYCGTTIEEVLRVLHFKELITGDLVDEQGNPCAIGTVCQRRGLDIEDIPPDDNEAVGKIVGISRIMAAEIEFENDDDFGCSSETPAQRWIRMRKWIDENLVKETTA